LPGVLRVNEREEKKRSVEEVEMCWLQEMEQDVVAGNKKKKRKKKYSRIMKKDSWSILEALHNSSNGYQRGRVEWRPSKQAWSVDKASFHSERSIYLANKMS
jgi:hypothetical protein